MTRLALSVFHEYFTRLIYSGARLCFVGGRPGGLPVAGQYEDGQWCDLGELRLETRTSNSAAPLAVLILTVGCACAGHAPARMSAPLHVR